LRFFKIFLIMSQTAGFNETKDCYNNCKIIHSKSLSKCSGCKIALYCSKLCQKEHWLAGHKIHCQFLSGKAKLPENCIHDDMKCEECKHWLGSEEVKGCPYKNLENSLEKYKKLCYDHLRNQLCDNHLQHTGKSIFETNCPCCIATVERMNIPFQLGELTGNYIDKIDRTLGQMVTILGNILQSDIPQEIKASLRTANANVMNNRAFYWSSLMSNRSKMHPIYLATLEGFLQDVTHGLMKYNKFRNIWSLFLLKFSSLLAQAYKFSALKFNRKDIIGRVEQFSKIIEKFEAWDGNSWADLNNLKMAIIYGIYPRKDPIIQSLTAPCSICSASVDIVKAVLVPIQMLVSIDSSLKEQFIVVHPGTFNHYFCCGSTLCLIFCENYSKEDAVSRFDMEKIDKNNHDVCDFCREWTDSPHRCSKCKCKLYCSKECQLEDWKVHMKMCKYYQNIGHKNVKTKNTFQFLFHNASHEFKTESVWNFNRFAK